MASVIKKCSVKIHGHQTSISLEPEFYAKLKGRAVEKNMTVSMLVEQIADEYKPGNLSSNIRKKVLGWAQEPVAQQESGIAKAISHSGSE